MSENWQKALADMQDVALAERARAEKALADRDESWANARQLQNQLASLRAEIEQLRDALADRDQELARVEARLEAVKALEDELFMALLAAGQSAWPDMMPSLVSYARELSIKLHAALSVAPQPQSGTKTAAELLREIAKRDPEGHKAALGRGYGVDRDPAYYPEPPASDEPVPDLMAALRASVEAAKRRRG